MTATDPAAAEPGALRLALTLGVAGLVSGLAIAGAYEWTLPRIEANRAAALRDAVLRVVPGATAMQPLALVDGRLVPRWAWLPLIGWVYTQAMYYIGSLFPALIPLNPGNWPEVPALLLYSALLLSCLYALIYRFRRVSSPLQRQQTKWVVFGLVCALLVLILGGGIAPIFFPSMLLPGTLGDLIYDLIGFTAMTELAYEPSGINTTYGRVKNPGIPSLFPAARRPGPRPQWPAGRSSPRSGPTRAARCGFPRMLAA